MSSEQIHKTKNMKVLTEDILLNSKQNSQMSSFTLNEQV